MHLSLSVQAALRGHSGSLSGTECPRYQTLHVLGEYVSRVACNVAHMLIHGCRIAFKLVCEPDSIPFAPLLHRDIMMRAAVSKTLKRGAATGAKSPRAGKKQRTASNARGVASQVLRESVAAASAHAAGNCPPGPMPGNVRNRLVRKV